jgi:hypothetical protein
MQANERGTIQGAIIVKNLQYVVGAIILVAALALAGCGHKLVAHGGDTTVAVYPDKESFEKLKHLQSEGGPAGMLGGLGASLVAKKVDNGTPIKVISGDDDGDQIEVLDGASKGMRGYVSKDSVD